MESVSTVDVAGAPARVLQLRHEIEQANYEYHVLDNPTRSDAEYDLLMRELRHLEQQFPNLRTDDSPTMRVGGQIAKGFRPRRHPRPMLSLANAFSFEDLDSWFQRVQNIVPRAAIDFVVEPKIDGLAIALTYTNGEFQVGATRGNGMEGEDVTANLKTVGDIPSQLAADPIPSTVEVRGEVYISIADFERLNKRRALEGQALFVNPRNSAAGSLRQLDPELTRQRPLSFFGYAIGYSDGVRIESQWQALELMRSWGFPVNPLVSRAHTLDEVKEYCARMTDDRERLGYEIDGVVVKISDVSLQEELGAVGREPRWAIAYKFAPREATTRLLDIQINVGRTGAINPFAVLEPVIVGGVSVKLATLHNEQDIQRKDIRIGDRVIVRRAGDVIPQVVKPIVEERDGSQQVYQIPDECPRCATPLVRPEGEAMHRCPNMECPAQRYRWIEHFVSEPAMDIRGLGEKLVLALLDHDLIHDPADLYSMTAERFLSLPGIKEKSAANLSDAIRASRNRPLSRVIFALGIRYVGDQTADLLAGAFGDIDRLTSTKLAELEAVDGIGHKIAQSIKDWSERAETREFLRRLQSTGVTWRGADTGPVGALSGRVFLITGRLENLSRSDAEAQLEALGAKIAAGMNKSVDYLIVGTDPGSKLDKAKKLGTPIQNEQWLQRVLEAHALPETEADDSGDV